MAGDVDAEAKDRPTVYALLWRAREVLMASPAWLDYVRAVYAIDPGGYPFLTYIGLNFTADTIKNYKFYFSFFRRLSPEEIATLLPVPDRGHFDALYAEWKPTHAYDTIHRGTTFALKVEPDGRLTHYYHLRTPGLPFGPPERLALQSKDRDNFHGVCEEFTGSAVHLKRYYYLRSPTTIAESLAIAGLDDVPDVGPIDWLEYIESEGRDKMDWITGSPALVDALIERHGPPRLASGLAKIRHDCRFELYGPGSARGGGDHSIYFVQHHGPHTTAGYYLFDGVGAFIRRHLKLEL
jgi:hypothetical protein